MISFLPKTRVGRWAARLSSLGLAVLVIYAFIAKQFLGVTDTSGGQSMTGKINDTFLTQLPMYSIFALLVLGGGFAVKAIIGRDRAVTVWVAGLLGLMAAAIFIGGFFMTA